MAFEAGLKINEFYSLLPRQFNNCIAGYTKRQTDSMQQSWEQARQLMFAVLSPNLKNKNATPLDVIKFPWDLKEIELDLEEQLEAIEENKKYWQEMDAKHKIKEIFKL